MMKRFGARLAQLLGGRHAGEAAAGQDAPPVAPPTPTSVPAADPPSPLSPPSSTSVAPAGGTPVSGTPAAGSRDTLGAASGAAAPVAATSPSTDDDETETAED